MDDAAYFLIQPPEYARAIPFARARGAYSRAQQRHATGTRRSTSGLRCLKTGQCRRALPLLQPRTEDRGACASGDDPDQEITKAKACLAGLEHPVGAP